MTRICRFFANIESEYFGQILFKIVFDHLYERKGYKISKALMFMAKRTMPVCLTADQYKKLEEIAKLNGMLDAGQAVEKMLREI